MAQFPSSVANDSNLYVAVNSLATTLVGALTSSGGNYSPTEIQVSDTTAWPTSGFITIDSEAISYTGISAGPARFTGISRGADGTIASAHGNGTAVKLNVIAAHHNVLKEEVKAVEQNLSDRIGLHATQIRAVAGSAASPSHTFAGDPDTGIFSIAANNIGISCGGITVIDVLNNAVSLFVNGGADSLDIRGQTAGDVTLRLAPNGATGNSGKLLGVLNGTDTNLILRSGGLDQVIVTPVSASIKGTNTNNDATAGYVGQRVVSVVATQSVGTTGNYFDITSISLTAGDWDVSGVCNYRRNGSTMSSSNFELGISIYSGNVSTGLVHGDTLMLEYNGASTTFSHKSMSLPVVRMSLSATTTVYLKGVISAYSGATPQVDGRISARRVR